MEVEIREERSEEDNASSDAPADKQSGETFDGPPTLERSGSEHQRAVTSLALLERARAWEWVKDPP